jgi:hypothetical protein
MQIGSGAITSQTAASLWQSRRRRVEELEISASLTDFFNSHVMRLQPHLALMTVGGIKVDTEYKEKLGEVLSAEVGHSTLQQFHD